MVQIWIRDQESCQPWIWDPGWKKWDLSSVADPNPDPHVLGLPDLDPISHSYESGSFYHHAKMVRKTLIPTILRLFLTFYL